MRRRGLLYTTAIMPFSPPPPPRRLAAAAAAAAAILWRNQTSKPEKLSENVLTGHMNSSDVAQPSKNNPIG